MGLNMTHYSRANEAKHWVSSTLKGTTTLSLSIVQMLAYTASHWLAQMATKTSPNKAKMEMN